eukprot:8916840-Pyramimonas_sp.AAC.1
MFLIIIFIRIIIPSPPPPPHLPTPPPPPPRRGTPISGVSGQSAPWYRRGAPGLRGPSPRTRAFLPGGLPGPVASPRAVRESTPRTRRLGAGLA